MSLLKMSASLAVVLVMTGSLLVRAEENGTAGGREATEAKATKADADKPQKKVRVIKPYAALESLTAEQRQQIADIHARFLVERKALEAKEEADIMAVLTDQQKDELARIKEENAAKAKKRSADAPTTKPTM